MRANTLGALLLVAAGCGRVGYDSIAIPDWNGPDAGDAAAPLPDAADGDPDAAVLPDVAADELPPPPDVVAQPDQGTDTALPLPDAGPTDRPPEAVTADLAPDGPPPCNQPFSAPVPLVIPGVTGDLYGPRLSPDGLTLFFGQQDKPNPNVVDIYVAVRASFGAPFGAMTAFTEANSSNEDNGAALTEDRLELFFYSTRAGGSGGRDIWVLRRSAVGAPWQPARPVTELNSGTSDYMPSLTGDALTIFFASNRTAGSADDIWTASRPSRAAPFGPPTRVAELSSLPTATTSPFVVASGLTLLFADERAGGQGARDLWTATRSGPGTPFAGPNNLGALFNSAQIDDDPSMSLDGRELFFVSDRTAATSRIYRAVRCP